MLIPAQTAALLGIPAGEQTSRASKCSGRPEPCIACSASELPDAEVIVVSNREPYIHNRPNGAIALQIPASGLVAALEPVMRACGGTWIAHGSGIGRPRERSTRGDRIRVPPDAPAYTLRRVWLTEEEQDGYYYGFANEGLWPLCHIAFVRPTFRESRLAALSWRSTQRFADAVVQRSDAAPIPSCWSRTITSRLLPRMIRERLPEATIMTFWHIPWPNAETFGICPWKEEIIARPAGQHASSAFTRSFTATISSRPSTASSKAGSTGSMPR